jgi:dinuclear metal center YbgI/SA1388 family protein
VSTTVGELVAFIDQQVPFSWAFDWDRVGLLAGDPSWAVERVYAAVDPSLTSLERAREAGAHVLLTHHPAFLEPLGSVVARSAGGRVVFEALRLGIALVNCHTNMDRAPQGADALPLLLGLEMLSPLEPENEHGAARAGRICRGASTPRTLADLSSHVGDVLGVRTRTWGDPGSPATRIAVAPGSGRSFVPAALASGCDTLVTGELRYHEALEALQAGLAVIEAGHDATERPLTAALAKIASEAPSLSEAAVVVEDAPYPWWIA